MSYGAMFSNSSGKQIIGSSETSYLYWGKVDTYIPWDKYGSIITPLFNIPRNVPVMVFIYNGTRRSTDRLSWSVGYNNNSRLQINYSCDYNQTGGQGTEGTCTAYIFVAANHVPVGTAWGLKIYNDKNQVSWHSGRPMLGFRYICTDDTYNSIPGNIVRPAAPSIYLGQTKKNKGSDEYDLYDSYSTITFSKWDTQFGIAISDSYLYEDWGQGWSVGRDTLVGVPVIGGGDYDPYPNLGNM